MKLAFPTNNQKTIANHIGLAKGFLIVDTNTGEKFYIENPVLQKINEIDLKNTEEAHKRLGTGRVIPPLLAEAGVDVLVAREFGEGMIRNLAREGIKVIETDMKDIEEFLKEGEMREVNLNENEFGYGRGFGRGVGYGRRFARSSNYERGFKKAFRNRGFSCRRWKD